MGRRDYKNARRPQAESPASKPRKSGGLAAGLLIGMVVGMATAGGLYWYINSQPSGLKTVESVPELVPPPAAVKPPEPEIAEVPAPGPARAAAPEKPAEAAEAPVKARPASADKKPDTKKAPAPDYSFYDILPGKAAPRPAAPVKAKPQHWLQVAALKSPADAERLKARLALLGLPVVMQTVEGGDAPLHRVRVGPFKTEDDGLGALDTLSENDFEPRWVKDPVTP